MPAKRDVSRRRAALPALAAALLAAAVPALAQVPCPANSQWVIHPGNPDFVNDPHTLCGFYQDAWQIFLYHMSPALARGAAPTTANAAAASPLRFETLPSLAETVGGPLAAAPARLLGPKTVFHDRRTGRDRVFQVRGSEPQRDIEQAGSKGVLVDQNGNVTYYEQFLDPLAKAFINACSATVKHCSTLPGWQPLRFPPGAMEIKVSYRVLTPSTPNANTYVTVPNVEVYNPQVKDPKTGKYGVIQTVNLGLVGYHLVFSTEHHPELIWATFEHLANAPDGPCTGPTTPPAPFKAWSFNNRASTDCAHINRWTSGQQPPYPITQAFRNWQYGSIPKTPNGDENTATLRALNQNVLGILRPSSVLRYYFLTGGVWTSGGALPATPQNEVGGLYLSNGTLETFTQTPNPNPQLVVSNCFSCHNTPSSGKPSYSVSHVVNTDKTSNCPAATPSKACLDTQKAH